MEIKSLITDKKHDTLGIIGGMGSMACEYLFNEIIENTYAENDQDHLEFFFFSKILYLKLFFISVTDEL